MRQFGIGTVAVPWFFLIKFPLLFQDPTAVHRQHKIVAELEQGVGTGGEALECRKYGPADMPLRHNGVP